MPAYPDDDDGAVLARLAEQGVDLSQPLLLEFLVSAPGEQAAEAIRAALVRQGYAPQVDYDEGEPADDGEIDPSDAEFGPSWTVCIEIEMLPAYDAIVLIQVDLDRIAEPLGGRSDGWGTLIE